MCVRAPARARARASASCVRASVPVCVHGCVDARAPCPSPCLLARSLACLLACLLARSLACVHACSLACSLARSLACLLAQLPLPTVPATRQTTPPPDRPAACPRRCLRPCYADRRQPTVLPADSRLRAADSRLRAADRLFPGRGCSLACCPDRRSPLSGPWLLPSLLPGPQIASVRAAAALQPAARTADRLFLGRGCSLARCPDRRSPLSGPWLLSSLLPGPQIASFRAVAAL